MNLLASVAISAVGGRGLNGADDDKLRKNYVSKRRRSLLQRVYEKERKQQCSHLKEYLICCSYADKIVFSTSFRLYIFGCILVGSLLVGLDSYPQYTNSYSLSILDSFVVYSFLLEVVLKIMSEGLEPQLYFIGSKWRWNSFDFCIVMLSLVPLGLSQIKVLRLIRIARIAQLFSNIPEIQMIVESLYNASVYNLYIFLLLLLIFYVFAIIGMELFRFNDPWNFGSIEVSLLTMLRVATLESWGDIFYLNYYGCADYAVSYYTTNITMSSTVLGGTYYCAASDPKPVYTTIYFLFFITLTAYCVVPLYIGAISMTMADSMYEASKRKEERRVKAEKKRFKELMAIYATSKLKEHIRQKKLITLAFNGLNLSHDPKPASNCRDPQTVYQRLAHECRLLTNSKAYNIFMAAVILTASVFIGMETTTTSATFLEISGIFDECVQYIFLLEFLIKVVGQEFQPWKYFHDDWNKLDVVILVVVFLPASTESSSLLLLRLLRLLRILKLVRIIPQLQVIIIALLRGMGGIAVVTTLLFVTLYFFAILGNLLFSANDPWHYGTLHMGLYSLFVASTLDNWATELMYIDLYGCAQYPWDFPLICTDSKPQFLATALFYTAFIFICALIMVSLFIGVVNINMEEAKYEEDEKHKVDTRAFKIATFDRLDRNTVFLYKDVFDAINITKSKKIGRLEMKLGLEVAGVQLTADQFETLYQRVDMDKNTSGIDFSEFLKFLLDTKDKASVAVNSSLRIKQRNDFVIDLDDNGVKRKKELRKRLMLNASKVLPSNEIDRGSFDNCSAEKPLGSVLERSKSVMSAIVGEAIHSHSPTPRDCVFVGASENSSRSILSIFRSNQDPLGNLPSVTSSHSLESLASSLRENKSSRSNRTWRHNLYHTLNDDQFSTEAKTIRSEGLNSLRVPPVGHQNVTVEPSDIPYQATRVHDTHLYRISEQNYEDHSSSPSTNVLDLRSMQLNREVSFRAIKGNVDYPEIIAESNEKREESGQEKLGMVVDCAHNSA